MKKPYFRILGAGLLAGLASEGLLGALFSSGPIRSVLYDPEWQSDVFIALTPTRDLLPSVAGLVLLSVIHSWLFHILQGAIPGRTWWRKGLFWGFTIWAMYWLFQEWFIYHTLLREPWLLNLLELTILLCGSLVEGCTISKFLMQPMAQQAITGTGSTAVQ
jgi:hypothetical protein